MDKNNTLLILDLLQSWLEIRKVVSATLELNASCEDLARKRFIITLLAHQDEEVLAAQLDNIRFYNPDAGIVLYNGGPDQDFAKHLNVCKFPYSHPLKYGNLAPFLWEVMKWLEDLHIEYKYLMNLDHDMLFVKHGFETFLDERMAQSDCMGWRLQNSHEHPDSLPIRGMSREWHKWQPVFKTDHFLSYFNPGQVYTHDIVRRMLSYVDHATVDQMLVNSKTFALEEVFFVTLALACGGRIREYPEGSEYNDMVHWGANITFANVLQSRQNPYYYWIHPIKGEELITLSQQLRTMSVEGPAGQQQLDEKVEPIQPITRIPNRNGSLYMQAKRKKNVIRKNFICKNAKRVIKKRKKTTKSIPKKKRKHAISRNLAKKRR
ncbi:hypothetical protein [Paenibacillus sedimenti]|uniref:Uncharacterized protein n=1 Tax=Paenibacillus sedimenti TaxID=2770274 RepID=A0A926KPF3_9BACL|nr:hypothetical protein [Paenibacillus sedimenti]MBD0381589.1 hypothetical protein [Paenibacillus sedimenti]